MATLSIQSAGKASRVRLAKRITSLGRAPGNDVILADPALPDTALHIHFDGRDFNAACHSGAEMSVNGRRRTTCRLSDGDVVRVGECELAFLAVDAAGGAVETPARSPTDVVPALDGLVRFSERLLRAGDFQSVLDGLLDALLDVTHAEKGFLILAESGRLEVKASRNLSRESVAGAIERISDSIVQKAIRTGEALLVADALHDTEWSAASSVVNLKLCSVLCAPIMRQGEPFGAIYLGNDSVVSLFSEGDLAALKIFAAQASLLVENALLVDGLRQDNARLRGDLEAVRFGEVVGSSTAMREVYRRVDKVAGTDVSVLICGETGTGKELIARELHRRSSRRDGPLVSVNCGAIPDGLLESELFGHVKGAFTGAIAGRPGRFQLAHGGTLFLDEIGEMPLHLQVKILRGLQERSVTRVGDTRPEQVDIRVIAATHRNLEEEIRKGTFREDLYYRLNVVSIEMPPLRQRIEDIPVLASYFLLRHAADLRSRARGFAPRAHQAMRNHSWPGNVRELENRVTKAAVLAERSLLTAEDLGLSVEGLAPILSLAQAKEEFQKRYINEVLQRNAGNRTQTARDLGVDPRTIFRHLEAERNGEPRQGPADDAQW